jgi:hypothetical protein
MRSPTPLHKELVGLRPDGGVEADQAAADGEEGLMDVVAALEADAQPPILAEPAIVHLRPVQRWRPFTCGISGSISSQNSSETSGPPSSPSFRMGLTTLTSLPDLGSLPLSRRRPRHAAQSAFR